MPPKHSERKLQAARDLMQYMAPGSVLEDLLDDASSNDDDDYFIPMATPATLGGGGAAALTHALVRASNPSRAANEQNPTTSMAKMQPQQHVVSKAVISKIKLSAMGDDSDAADDWGTGGAGGGGTGGRAMNHKVLNELRGATNVSSHSSKNVDRSERATVENVMDPRTRMILYKLVNSGFLKEINGCVSTGKEANVYYAVSGDGTPAALKVFKTSILVFKDRDQYVTGEFRFQSYCKSNPRKMVRTWAEKEARNLTRLANAGIHAPRVRLLRQHVLIMDFIGDDGWPAPRLKEVAFPTFAALDRCYLDLLVMMRTMFTQCRLVHGDLSEYNLLVDGNGKIVMIDVSQSVEHDHPHAMTFLRRDIVNVNTFFRAKGHRQLFSLQRVFHFITAPTLAIVTAAATPAASAVLAAAGAAPAAMAVPLPIAAAGAGQFSQTETAKMMLAKLNELRAADDAAEEAADARRADEADDNDDDNCSDNGESAAAAAAAAAIEEQVFLSINMPRTLAEISESRKPNAEIRPFVEAMLAPKAQPQATPATGDMKAAVSKKDKKRPGKKGQKSKGPKPLVTGDIDDDDEEEEDEIVVPSAKPSGKPSVAAPASSSSAPPKAGATATAKHADPAVVEDSTSSVSSGSSDDDSSSGDDDDDDDDGHHGEPREKEVPKDVVKFMSKDEKKEHKKTVKQANRERRETKMPKSEKRRATRRVKHK